MPGYSCEDHFLERDTIDLSWQCIHRQPLDCLRAGRGRSPATDRQADFPKAAGPTGLLADRELYGILCDVGPRNFRFES